MPISRAVLPTAGALALLGSPLLAQDAASVGEASFVMNTLFVALSAILVMWMAAGFTMLETGLVRAKNVATQCAKNIGLFAVASTCFFLTGFSLLYPGSEWTISGVIGGFGPADIGGVAAPGTQVADGASAATGASVLYQMMFCAATASIVSGTLAERLKLLPFFIFTAILTALIYPIQASWTWGGGFLDTALGFKDLAGSTVVHVVGGAAALTGAIVVGARSGRFQNGMAVPMPGSNLPLASLGALILWMGWFGFTAGSYVGLSTEADAANVSRILINTNMAAAGGVVAAFALSYFKFRQMDLTFMINGALAGLVSITAEPLYPSPFLALMIGAVGGMIVVLTVPLLDKLKIDDVVGAVPVHFVCGIWGTIAVVISNPEATMLGQIAGVAIVTLFAGVTSFAVWVALDKTLGMRVRSEDETNGLDLSELGQEAYPEFSAA